MLQLYSEFIYLGEGKKRTKAPQVLFCTGPTCSSTLSELD